MKRVRFDKNEKANNEIIYAICTNNLEELKKHINESNINNIIDSKNNYNALHYGIKNGDNKIITFLEKMGAKFDTFNKDGHTLDLCIKYHCKYPIQFELDDKKETIRNLKENNDLFHLKNNDLQFQNNSLQKELFKSCNDNRVLTKENYTLSKENIFLKESLKDEKLLTEKLESEVKFGKRKRDELQEAFNNLLKSTKK